MLVCVSECVLKGQMISGRLLSLRKVASMHDDGRTFSYVYFIRMHLSWDCSHARPDPVWLCHCCKPHLNIRMHLSPSEVVTLEVQVWLAAMDNIYLTVRQVRLSAMDVWLCHSVDVRFEVQFCVEYLLMIVADAERWVLLLYTNSQACIWTVEGDLGWLSCMVRSLFL